MKTARSLPRRELFSFADYTYTRDLEQHLDDIANGKATYNDVLSDHDTRLNTEIAALRLPISTEFSSASGDPGPQDERPELPCLRCKEGTVRKPHGQGSFGCSRYKDGCTYKVGTRVAGKVITDKQAATLITKGRIGPLRGFTSKVGKPFEASLTCTGESDWKTVFELVKSR